MRSRRPGESVISWRKKPERKGVHMIKKLQRKFVVITMVSLLAVLLLVVGGIKGLNIYQITGKSDILLEMLIEN